MASIPLWEGGERETRKEKSVTFLSLRRHNSRVQPAAGAPLPPALPYLHLLEDDALGHGGSTERVGLHVRDGVRLVPRLAGPLLITSVHPQFAAGVGPRGFTVKNR